MSWSRIVSTTQAWIRPASSSGKPVLFCHGNGQTIEPAYSTALTGQHRLLVGIADGGHPTMCDYHGGGYVCGNDASMTAMTTAVAAMRTMANYPTGTFH